MPLEEQRNISKNIFSEVCVQKLPARYRPVPLKIEMNKVSKAQGYSLRKYSLENQRQLQTVSVEQPIMIIQLIHLPQTSTLLHRFQITSSQEVVFLHITMGQPLRKTICQQEIRRIMPVSFQLIRLPTTSRHCSSHPLQMTMGL